MADTPVIAYFLGASNDWGGASRSLLNFVRKIDRAAFSPLVVIPQPGRIQPILSAQRIDCEVWPVHDRDRNPFKYFADIRRCMVFFKRHEIALLHLNWGLLGWKPAEIIAARLLGIPIVNHLHVAMSETSSYLGYSSHLVGVSGYVCRHTNCRGVQCDVVHNMADFDRFASARPARTRLGLRDDSVVVGFLGQIRRIKGIDSFLELAKRVPDPDVEFVIAGELRGEDSYSEAQFAAMIAGDPRIRYLGYRDNVEEVYASCDVIVMPSQWEEPCAMVLFEASAAGKPLVATATGGTPEILVEGETGFLVEKDDVQTLADRVRRLVRDRSLRESIGGRAREVAAARFANAPVRQLEELYRALLRKRVCARA